MERLEPLKQIHCVKCKCKKLVSKSEWNIGWFEGCKCGSYEFEEDLKNG